MPTGMAKAKITPDKVLAELTQLSARELDKVLEGAAALRLEKRKLSLPKRESDLFRVFCVFGGLNCRIWVQGPAIPMVIDQARSR